MTILRINSKIFYQVSLILSLSLLFYIAHYPEVNAQENVDLNNIIVRVYNGGADQKNIASETALYYMFEWMGANTDWINAEDILNGGLENINLLAMPAISPYSINSESTSAGGQIYEVRSMIQEFIRGGGAYFGIYGGHYFEWSGYDLFDIRLTFPNPNVSTSEEIKEISINTALSTPFLSKYNDTMSMLSWNPGYFKSFGETNFITIATYPENDLPAMVCFHSGLGRVFISSPHPEHEENNERDGTTFYDYLDDPETEWEFLRSITKWLVSKNDIIIFWSTTIVFGGFLTISILYIVLKKRQ